MSVTLLPAVSVKPSRVSYYTLFEGLSRNKNREKFHNEQITESTKHNGVISKKANTRVRDAIDWMLFLSENKTTYSIKRGKNFSYKLGFLTLTLASKQRHSDNEIKKTLLNHFLVVLRSKYKVSNYLWRAEAQLNGNIHFHIVVDKFIAYQEIRKDWNRIQDKLGYIAHYSSKMKEKYKKGFYYSTGDKYHRGIIQQLHAYRLGVRQGWYNPNSTDIHSIKKVRNLSAYIAKYCSKNSNEIDEEGKSTLRYRAIEGKLWGLSNSLSSMKSAKDLCTNAIQEDYLRLKKCEKIRFAEFDYVTVFFVNTKELKEAGCGALLALFFSYVQEFKKKKSS